MLKGYFLYSYLQASKLRIFRNAIVKQRVEIFKCIGFFMR